MCKQRCDWAKGAFPEYELYHDEEWGVPVHDDQVFFEFLILEGAQAGLSWSTVLRKRKGYRMAFDNFDVHKVAAMNDETLMRLENNSEIIRNKLKIQSAVNNAKRFIEIQNEFGSFDQYVWSFVNNKTIHGHWHKMSDVPATTKESENLSKDLKKRGFKFVGSTIMYAFMQATGLVNDHVVECFRYQELKAL